MATPAGKRGPPAAYSAVTLNGNWVEERYAPGCEAVAPPGSTTTATMNLEATKTSLPKYGAQLMEQSKFDDTIDYKNTVGYDTMSYPDKWQSVTQSMHAPPASAKVTEFSTSFHMPHPVGTDPDSLTAYRKRWLGETKDTSDRYTSEHNRSVKGSVPKQFEVSVKRKYPGVPKSVEEFRERLMERHGNLAVVKLGRLMRIMDTSGDGTLSRLELKMGLKDLQLEFSEAEFFALWAYFDKDRSDYIDYDELLEALRGPLSTKRAMVVTEAFAKFDKTGDGVVTLADLVGTYDASFHPDVKAGKITAEECLTDFLATFEHSGEADGVCTLQEFANYYRSMGAGIDDDDAFEAIVRSAWRLDA